MLRGTFVLEQSFYILPGSTLENLPAIFCWFAAFEFHREVTELKIINAVQ